MLRAPIGLTIAATFALLSLGCVRHSARSEYVRCKDEMNEMSRLTQIMSPEQFNRQLTPKQACYLGVYSSLKERIEVR